MEKLKQKISERGSILAYSLIIMSVMLMIAVGISSVSIIGKKSASTTGSSTQTLQTADSGIKLAIKELQGAVATETIENVFGSANCNADNSVDLNSAGLPGAITVSFFREDGITQLACTATIDQIASIRSSATHENTTRAVQVALAAGSTTVINCSNEISVNNTFTGWASCAAGKVVNLFCSTRASGEVLAPGFSGKSIISNKPAEFGNEVDNDQNPTQIRCATNGRPVRACAVCLN